MSNISLPPDGPARSSAQTSPVIAPAYVVFAHSPDKVERIAFQVGGNAPDLPALQRALPPPANAGPAVALSNALLLPPAVPAFIAQNYTLGLPIENSVTIHPDIEDGWHLVRGSYGKVGIPGNVDLYWPNDSWHSHFSDVRIPGQDHIHLTGLHPTHFRNMKPADLATAMRYIANVGYRQRAEWTRTLTGKTIHANLGQAAIVALVVRGFGSRRTFAKLATTEPTAIIPQLALLREAGVFDRKIAKYIVDKVVEDLAGRSGENQWNRACAATQAIHCVLEEELGSQHTPLRKVTEEQLVAVLEREAPELRTVVASGQTYVGTMNNGIAFGLAIAAAGQYTAQLRRNDVRINQAFVYGVNTIFALGAVAPAVAFGAAAPLAIAFVPPLVTAVSGLAVKPIANRIFPIRDWKDAIEAFRAQFKGQLNAAAAHLADTEQQATYLNKANVFLHGMDLSLELTSRMYNRYKKAFQ